MAIIIETMQQAHEFTGTRKPAGKLSVKTLRTLKEDSQEGLKMLQMARLNETNPAIRMQYNGSISSRTSIINKIDQLLKMKNI